MFPVRSHGFCILHVGLVLTHVARREKNVRLSLLTPDSVALKWPRPLQPLQRSKKKGHARMRLDDDPSLTYRHPRSIAEAENDPFGWWDAENKDEQLRQQLALHAERTTLLAFLAGGLAATVALLLLWSLLRCFAES